MAIVTTAIVASHPSSSSSDNSSSYHMIECRPEGVYVNFPNAEAYELCVDNYCITENTPPIWSYRFLLLISYIIMKLKGKLKPQTNTR
ncbi:hypothetical protein RB195_023887 [Necator americanus]|uniref:Uncharacterized protein n=1 Tax=Necator americanus TaxID=51031 RepID=A0ABR1EN81_NECAM